MYREHRVWKNLWVPRPVGVSPIQHWPALHIWLYIFSKGAELTITAQGSLSARAPHTQKEAEDALNTAVDIIMRAEECVGCGICTGRCPIGALFLNEEKKVDIHPELCQHCRLCIGKCPVVDFRGDREFEV